MSGLLNTDGLINQSSRLLGVASVVQIKQHSTGRTDTCDHATRHLRPTHVDQELLLPAKSAKTPSGANFVNRRVAKSFEVDDTGRTEAYYATVTKYYPAEENEYDQDLWHIIYEDKDEEHFNTVELDKALKLYADLKSQPPVAEVQ
jgi:hypothetical protein